MAEMKQLEFFLLRYVPDAVKGEFINFGVVLLEPGGGGEIRLLKDWRRLLCADPDADLEWLQAMEKDIRDEVKSAVGREEFLRKMQDSFSNSVQLSAMQGVTSENMEAALHDLESLYLKTIRTPALKYDVAGRRRLVALAEGEFKKADVLGLIVRNFDVARYTKPGDPQRFDFGWSVGKEFRFLQAVSVKKNIEQGVLLAARFPEIRKAIFAKDGVQSKITALIEEGVEQRDEIGFVLGMMREAEIRVAMESEMPAIAQEVRTELRV
ncbi:MAG: hypothetical protein DMG91_00030 [Acidobacteria bacterium]|jgi:hypothetical protein|nr:MAG: hypothetical protein DMG91_00030 [Acidobacteriota bacterium]